MSLATIWWCAAQRLGDVAFFARGAFAALPPRAGFVFDGTGSSSVACGVASLSIHIRSVVTNTAAL